MMKNIACMMLTLLTSAIALRAQSPNATTNAAANANGAPAAQIADPNQAWNNLVNLSKPAPASRVNRRKDTSPEEVKAKLKQQADRSWRTVEEARQFYTRFPDHAKAVEARKIEAISVLRAVRDDAAHDQFAKNTAIAFRDNKSFPTADRVEVALALERYLLSQKIKNKAVNDQPSEWIKLGEDVEKQFGDAPAIQTYYIEIARKAESATANQIARKVAHSSAASQGVRAEARSILDRAAMLGRPLQVKLPKIRGGEVDLARQQNKITALVVWSPADPEGLASLNAFRNGLPDGVQIIYLSVGNVSALLNAQNRLPAPGVICYFPVGPGRPAMENALNLRYAPAPCVYVLDRAGNVVAIGRINELPALLVKALG